MTAHAHAKIKVYRLSPKNFALEAPYGTHVGAFRAIPSRRWNKQMRRDEFDHEDWPKVAAILWHFFTPDTMVLLGRGDNASVNLLESVVSTEHRNYTPRPKDKNPETWTCGNRVFIAARWHMRWGTGSRSFNGNPGYRRYHGKMPDGREIESYSTSVRGAVLAAFSRATGMTPRTVKPFAVDLTEPSQASTQRYCPRDRASRIALAIALEKWLKANDFTRVTVVVNGKPVPERVYECPIGNGVYARVFTTISTSTGVCHNNGKDAIKVVAITYDNNGKSRAYAGTARINRTTKSMIRGIVDRVRERVLSLVG